MKTLLIIWMCLCTGLCMAQTSVGDGTHVTVHAGENALETLLTEEQKQSVTHLTVTGTLLDADYTFLRDRLYGQLDTLNLRTANIDTLPDIRTEDIWASSPNKIHLILPLNIEHIGTNFLSQFSGYNIEVTGNFPTFGASFSTPPYSYGIKVLLSEDNFSYKTKISKTPDKVPETYYSSIYSLDEETLYYMNIDDGGEYTIKEGTKVIHGTAFRNLILTMSKLILPASLDSIGDYAFEHTLCLMLVGYVNKPYPTLGHWEPGIICEAIEPPKLGKDVFKESVLMFSYLYVHEACIERYKQADGWNSAIEVRAIEKMGDYPHSVLPLKKGEENISVTTTPDSYELTFGQKPLYMEMYNTNGVLLTKHPIESSSLSIDRNRLVTPCTIVCVHFTNGTTETVKLIP